MSEQELSPCQVLVQVRSLRKVFVKRGLVSISHQVLFNGFDLDLYQGELLGLVGPSGSGKSTLGKIIAGLEGYEGSVKVLGREVRDWVRRDRRGFAKVVQIVFQDPLSSIDPLYKIGSYLYEAVRLHFPELRKKWRSLVSRFLKRVGLGEWVLDRYPSQLSGGQRQRIALVRALLLSPAIVVFDEITSSLDKDSEREILEIVKDLRETGAFSGIFISHDLSLVESLCDRMVRLSARG